MAEIKQLSKFMISKAGEAFKLHIEDEAGHVLELTATRDHLDIIDDALAEILEESDDAEEVGG